MIGEATEAKSAQKMDFFKFVLGPYEFFSSIIGGIPLIFLFYNPAISVQELVLMAKTDFSIQFLVVLFFFSYLLAGLVQGITWKFFLALCDIFGQSYHYFKDELIIERDQALQAMNNDLDRHTLDFEDKLVLLLRQKVGIPKNIGWIYSRLHTYLKENNRPSVVTADLYQATHIMYRNISFGFLLISLVMLLNLIRVRAMIFEQLVLSAVFVLLAYVAFLRSASFKRWYSREVMLGFYFAASQQ